MSIETREFIIVGKNTDASYTLWDVMPAGAVLGGLRRATAPDTQPPAPPVPAAPTAAASRTR
ncbi:hypothetical protein ACFYY2_31470 [Streptomyces sp. NPDC001822]|uniref:hypothetical protein n=1 Tax=Streptomyces sp. NPDC001822 TaxID=3364614 RepID=UPI0036CD3C3B